MRRIILTALVLLSVVGFTVPVMAIGLGLAFSGGVSKVYSFDTSEGDGHSLAYGGSLFLDTAVAQDSLFNYRLHFTILGFDQETSEGKKTMKLKEYDTPSTTVSVSASFAPG